MFELMELLGVSAPVISNTVKTIGTIAGAGMVGASTGVAIDRFKNYIFEIRQDNYENKILEPTEFVIGYRKNGKFRIPIALDMVKNPHMLVCGLSQQGKTRMVEYAIKNKNSVLINTFDHDFKSINPLIRANGIVEMEKTLKYLTEEMQGNNEPIFVVIDEILEMVLSGSKDMSKYITRLLATAAHNKIYIIAICQSAEKEIIKFKNLFNIRVCFRMREEINYKTALGYSPEEPNLMPREFYYAYNECGMGYTYDV